MKRSLVFSILILLLSITEISSQVTISYDVAVTTASGTHASLFPAAERASISYTLDPAAVDSNADPARGIFNNAVLSMSISFPGIGVFTNTGAAGLAQTFDNFGTTCSVSDQVFIHGGPISTASLLGGETIDSVEVDFLSAFVTPPAMPGMLSSDALPLVRLPLTDAFVIFRTATGNTFVHFSPPPRDRIQSIVNRIETLVSLGVLTRAQADRLLSKLDSASRALDRGNVRGASDNLRDFVSRVNELIDDGVLSRPTGQFLIDGARDIRDQIGS